MKYIRKYQNIILLGSSILIGMMIFASMSLPIVIENDTSLISVYDAMKQLPLLYISVIFEIISLLITTAMLAAESLKVTLVLVHSKRIMLIVSVLYLISSIIFAFSGIMFKSVTGMEYERIGSGTLLSLLFQIVPSSLSFFYSIKERLIKTKY